MYYISTEPTSTSWGSSVEAGLSGGLIAAIAVSFLAAVVLILIVIITTTAYLKKTW